MADEVRFLRSLPLELLSGEPDIGGSTIQYWSGSSQMASTAGDLWWDPLSSVRHTGSGVRPLDISRRRLGCGVDSDRDREIDCDRSSCVEFSLGRGLAFRRTRRATCGSSLRSHFC